ncbi:fatty acid desaturase [Actinoplanes sp. NBC_00393]|uniref:fatty acid desaturase n=1 Tax=Actinoplanes sp. NBC_00393 TaxID=2975953 RepID=UPI002E233800
MVDTTPSSPFTGTVLPQGPPFWIVDGLAYDFSEWADTHPGGNIWFETTQGRDISALFHTYHRDPARLRRILAKYRIDGPTAADVLPKMGVPPFLMAPEFDASKDLPRLEYAERGSLLAAIRAKLDTYLSRPAVRRHDRAFDVVTALIGAAHVGAFALLLVGIMPAWLFVVTVVLTRTALAGAGHYHIHRRSKPGRRRFAVPFGKALFDVNYVGTCLIGTDGHVLLHHPYLGSGADVKRTFFDGMLRLHPLLRVPGYTLHKFGILVSGLGVRGYEVIARERERHSYRLEFWLVRALLLAELIACLATGHVLAWIAQFVITLWINTFLVVASHDFEDAEDDDLAAIPGHLRNDWAAQQVCLSYDLSVVGNRWIDLFLTAGLSPHRVHHVLPYQRSGFANLASERAVREACEEAGIVWERPRNLLTERFPATIRHYLLAPPKRTGVPPSRPPADRTPPPEPPQPTVAEERTGPVRELAEFGRYCFDGWRGVGV